MNAYFESLSPYQCRPPYQSEVLVTSGWISSGAKGTTDSEGTSRCWFSRTLIKATSTVYLPALRSARTRLTVSVALPVETSTLTPNFFVKASTTGRYWRDGAPPDAIARVPSCFAAAASLDHSASKFAGAAAAAEAMAALSKKKNDPTDATYPADRSDERAARKNSPKVPDRLAIKSPIPLCATNPKPTRCGR